MYMRNQEKKEGNRNLRKLCAVKSQGFKADRGTYAATGKGAVPITSAVLRSWFDCSMDGTEDK